MERLNPAFPPLADRMGVLGFLSMVALALLIVGGLNWALVGLLNLDLIAALFGPMTTASRVIYVLVGLAAVYALSLLPRVARLN